MKAKYKIGTPAVLLLVFFMSLFLNAGLASAQNTTAVVGSMGTYGGGFIKDNSGIPGFPCSLVPRSTVAEQTLIYTNNNQSQIFGGFQNSGCPNYITINTNDRLQITCPNGSITLYGPGTFTPSAGACQVSPSVNNSYALYLVASYTVLGKPCSLSVSPPIVSPGGTITISGAGFFATNNTVTFTNNTYSAGSFTLNNFPSPNTTQISVAIPTSAYPGSYTVSVPSAPNCTNTSLQVRSTSNAPSNLTASLDISGKVTLKWINNDPNQTGVVIERATKDDQSNFTQVGSVAASVTTYSDDLSTVSLPGTKESYRVRALHADGTMSDYSNIGTASNCVKISGAGPDNFIFMRGKSWNTGTLAALVAASKDMINNGFNYFDPFKYYFSKLSFSVDFRQVDDSAFPTQDGAYTASANALVAHASSCDATGNAFEYVFLFGGASNVADFAYRVNRSKDASGNKVQPAVAYANQNRSFSGITAVNNPVTVIHESGHAIGNLKDEYLDDNSVSLYDSDFYGVLSAGTLYAVSSTENCTADPDSAYRSPTDNHLYGAPASVSTQGCEYAKTSDAKPLYRPSLDSVRANIMNDSPDQTSKFDVISCGYVADQLDGNLSFALNTVAPYWSLCMNMNTDKTGIVPASPAPSISSISDKTLAPGQGGTGGISQLSSKTASPNITITGSGFAKTPDNTVKLTNTLSSNIYYEVPNIASSDGKTLSFAVPSTIPLGKYNLQVGGLNTDWSKPLAVTVLAPTTGAGTPAPGPTIPPLYDFGGMYGGNAVTLNPATGGRSCPTGYGAVLIYNSTSNHAYDIYMCVRAHVTGQDPFYDFGGIYETPGGTPFTNPPRDENVATGQMTCPAGFSAAQILGGNAATDGSMNFCYSPYSSGNRFYNFGGMYYSSANIVTGAKSCPTGYTKLTLTALPLTYCYQPMYQPAAAPVVKATALSSSQIQLSWTISNTTGLNSYTVHDYLAAPVYDANYDVILHAFKDGISASTTSYVVSGLGSKTNYCFSVKANAFYDVPESNQACATTLAPSAAPATMANIDFGGMYGGVLTNSVNPATGALSCPTGYTSILVNNATTDHRFDINLCARAHVAGQDSLYDFGGMYAASGAPGLPHDDNVATGKVSCPTGFTNAQISGGYTGAAGAPSLINFCYRQHSSASTPFYNFGGVYASQPNITTGNKSCPTGFTAKTLTTFAMTYCYQPVSTVPPVPVLTATAISGSQIRLSWTIANLSGVTSYTIHDYPLTNGLMITYYDNNQDILLHTLTSGISSSVSAYTVSSLSPKTKYCYSIKANALYDVAESTAVCATTLAGTSQQDSDGTLKTTSTDTTTATPTLTALAPAADTTLTIGQSSLVNWTSSNAPSGSVVSVWIQNRATGAYNELSTSLPTAGPMSIRFATDMFGVALTPGTYTVEVRVGTALKSVAPGILTLVAATSNTASTPPPSQLNPSISGITGPTQMNVGDSGKWTVAASDPQGNTMNFSVDWGDSTTANSSVPSFKHSYASAGNYTITFTVRDSVGLLAQTTSNVSIQAPTPVTPPPTTNSLPSSASVTASAVDAASDKVSYWDIFAPGPGRVNSNPNDFHISMTLSLPAAETLQSVTIISANSQGWSSSASANNSLHSKLYPLMLNGSGIQTTAYDQTFPIPAGQTTLDIYIQPEIAGAFPGGTLTVGFADGTSLTTQIPASSVTPTQNSTASVWDAIATWLHAGFGW